MKLRALIAPICFTGNSIIHPMTNLWHPFMANWAIPLALWVFGTFVGATFRWRYGSYKEWKEECQEKAEKTLDANVLQFLGDHQIWNSSDISEGISADREAVIACLDRLEMRGRVRSESGTMDDPARVYWLLGR